MTLETGVAPSNPTETSLALTRRARKLHKLLTETHPDAHCELDFTTPLELAVATILSAQSTDVGVNRVTPTVFAKYRTAADYAGADRAELEELLRPTGFFRNKTSSVIGLGQALVERYDGELPSKLKDLVTLPGIGRKTANVIIGNAFGGAGITVDTHFGRLVRRFGLDHRGRPGQGRVRDRGAVPAQGLDHALAPGDLPRAAGLPRPQAGVRGLHAQQALPVVRPGPDRSRRGGQAAEGAAGGRTRGDGGRVRMRAVVRALMPA